MSQRIKNIRQLHKPADQIACLIVQDLRKNMLKARRAWLNQATNPNDNLQQDSEALHNFRVEMRRLRVWLKQARDLIRTKSQARLQLKQWANESNTGRDLEVMLGLLQQLQQANTEINSSLPTISLIQENKKLEGLISQQPLALKPRTDKHAQRDKQHLFALWLAERLSTELEKTLSLLNEDDESLHKARIHIKHMRYLIEPIASFELNSSQRALSQLKAMQTTLGDLHDLYVLRQRLPDLLCEQLHERLTNRLQQPGTLTRGIQQDFTATRNQFTLYLRWQSARYEAAMKDWHSSSTQTCTELEHALNDLINELKNA